MFRRSGSESDTAFFDAQKDAISVGDMVIVVVNAALGVGIFSFGYTFRMGLGLAILMLLIFGLASFYSMYLFIKLAQSYRKGTFEEIWTLLFSKRSSYICAIVSVSAALLALILSFQTIYQCLYLVFDYFFTAKGTWLEHQYFYLLLVDVVLIIPMCFSESLRDIAKISYVGNTCALALLIHAAYECGRHTSIYGFDPHNQLTLCSFAGDFGNRMGNIVVAYLVMPFAWPGLHHLHNPTPKRWWVVFGTMTLILFIYYIAMGVLAYLTFFDENRMDSIILDLYESSEIVTLAAVVATVKMAAVGVTFLNQARYITLSSLSAVVAIDRTAWTTCGIGWAIMCTFCATLSTPIMNILLAIYRCVASVLLFIIPSVLFLRGYGKRLRIHFAGSILLILIGIACIVNTIYHASVSK